MCIAFSSRGHRQKWADQSSSILAVVWFYLISQTKPDIFIHECTARFTEDVIKVALSDDYIIESKLLCPTDFGLPARRPRRYTLGRKKSSMRILVDFDGDGSMFSDLFFREVRLSGDAYCKAPPGLLKKYKVERAASLKLPSTVGGKMWPEHLLTTDANLRSMKKYCQLKKSHPKYSECTLADVSQSSGTPWRTLHRFVPTILRNSNLWNFVQERWLHPLEYLHILNVPVWSRRHRFALRNFCGNLSLQDCQSICGNGMNLSQVGIVLLFALAASSKKDGT